MSSINIKERRLAMGLTLNAFAKAIGVNSGTVYHWESKNKVLSQKSAQILASFFSCSVDELGLPIQSESKNIICEKREALGMSQAELARKIGVSRSTLCKWEAGKSVPMDVYWKPLSKCLGCSEDDLRPCFREIYSTALTEKRLALKLKKSQVGKALGVDRSAVVRWERGIDQPSNENLRKLTALFQCPATDLGIKRTAKSPLQQARLDRVLAQEEVAQQLGVSRYTVHRWESGRHSPSDHRLMQLSELYGRPINKLGFLLKKVKPVTISERNTLLMENLDIISKVISKNWPLVSAARINPEDLKQELTIRAMRAVETYRPDKGSLRSHIWNALQWEIRTQAAEANRHGVKSAPRGFRASFSSIEALSEAGMQFSTDSGLFL